LYFSSYEVVKAAFSENGQVTTVGSSLAGAAAVTAHDLIMTPLDTLKQRMQLGHYTGVMQAVRQVYTQEGIIALYRSFPITLLTNVPYGMVMVSTHEACKKVLREAEDNGSGTIRPAWQTVLAASSVAGLVASAITTPLDRIKTALQTQQLAPVCGATGKQQLKFCLLQQTKQLKHANWQQAAITIFKEEGPAGFVRGITPRILAHTPAVAISWTTYETAKQYLLQHF
jgi:solute carrier family 25 iron transporter 28/37